MSLGEMGLGRCRTCHAPILWVRMAGSGKANPLDPEPREDGNIVLDDEGDAVYLRPRQGGSALVTYVSHFSTCPDSKQHRRTS